MQCGQRRRRERGFPHPPSSSTGDVAHRCDDARHVPTKTDSRHPGRTGRERADRAVLHSYRRRGLGQQPVPAGPGDTPCSATHRSAGVRDSAGRASSTTGLVRPTSSPAPLGGRTERAQAGAAPTGATGIVRDAISASGGLGEPWCLDGVTAVRVGNVLLEVDAWLRNAACPMAWRRVEPGLYRCGGYVVGQLDTGEWFADGPVVDRCFDHKRDAQAACAAARR